jgi:hypothetical protein
MAGTISTRITLDGQDEVRRAFEQLAAAINRLSPQFKQLTTDTQAFGTAGVKATEQVVTGLNQTAAAADKAGTSLLSAATKFGIAAAGIAVAINAVVRSLTSGAGETAQEISRQADKLTLTIPQWLKYRAAIEAAGGSAEGFIRSTAPLLGVLNKLSLETSGKTMQTFADGASVTIFQMTKISEETKKLTDELAKFGISLQEIQKGDSAAIMEKLATAIAKMPDGAAKAAAGVRFFGQDWKNTIATLTAGISLMNDSRGALGQMRIATRQLSAEQVKDAKDAADQWDDLGKAIRALKDQIGALFSGSSFDRAKWLTDMVDDARILLTTFLKLNQAGRADFLANLKDSAGATVFKVLVATGQQLAGVWNVLVSAGGKLFGVLDGIAGIFEGITGSQVAAFFITAAIAAASFALALKGLSLLLTPLTLLLSLFSGFGPVLLIAGAAALLFWDQIVGGAQKAAALIPAELEQIKAAFGKLFSGDFVGFWNDFSNAATTAFRKIEQGPDDNWVKTLIGFLKQIPGTIELIVKAFIGLGEAAQGVANIINQVFGTKLTGLDIAAIAIIGTMTGAFVTLANAVAIAAGAFGILVAVFSGPVAAAIVAAGVIVFELVRKWDDLKAHALDCFTNIGNGINWLVGKIGELASTVTGAMWDAWQATGGAAIDWIGQKIDWLINKFKDAVAWASKLFSAGGGGTPEGAAPGMAHGGMIGGRGTGTSDSNLAWVSRGEHIMPARAVRQPGVLAFLEALRRSGGDLSRVLDGMGRFAAGGLVMPAMASGGIGGMSHVTIQFPGMPAIGGLRASSAVVEQLQRAAAMAQVRSGGRKPSRYG